MRRADHGFGTRYRFGRRDAVRYRSGDDPLREIRRDRYPEQRRGPLPARYVSGIDVTTASWAAAPTAERLATALFAIAGTERLGRGGTDWRDLSKREIRARSRRSSKLRRKARSSRRHHVWLGNRRPPGAASQPRRSAEQLQPSMRRGLANAVHRQRAWQMRYRCAPYSRSDVRGCDRRRGGAVITVNVRGDDRSLQRGA